MAEDEEIVRLASRRPDAAGTVARTVHRMLERRAGDRWPSVAEAIAAMHATVGRWFRTLLTPWNYFDDTDPGSTTSADPSDP